MRDKDVDEALVVKLYNKGASVVDIRNYMNSYKWTCLRTAKFLSEYESYIEKNEDGTINVVIQSIINYKFKIKQNEKR